MERTQLTIYRIDSIASHEEMISEFNEGKKEDKQFIRKTNKEHEHFRYIVEYDMYARTVITNPKWGGVLDDIVE